MTERCRLTVTTLLLALGTAAAADPAADGVVSQLREQGYVEFTVDRTWLGRIQVIAVAPDGSRREVVFSPATGEILRDYLVPTEDGTPAPQVLDRAEDDQATGGAPGDPGPQADAEGEEPARPASGGDDQGGAGAGGQGDRPAADGEQPGNGHGRGGNQGPDGGNQGPDEGDQGPGGGDGGRPTADGERPGNGHGRGGGQGGGRPDDGGSGQGGQGEGSGRGNQGDRGREGGGQGRRGGG